MGTVFGLENDKIWYMLKERKCAYKLIQSKTQHMDGGSKRTRRSQELGLPCSSLSSPCSASMCKKSNTSLLKGRVRRGDGDSVLPKDGQTQQHMKGA